MKIRVSKEITLREIDLLDSEDVFNTVTGQREYLGKWLPFVEFTKEIGDTQEFIKSVTSTPEDLKEFVFVILYKNVFAGLAGFKSTDRLNKKTEIGYWLSEGFQKKGIMTRSVKAMLKLAFEELDINRIQIKCAVGNIPSSSIPKRLGFKLEGIERDGELFPDGSFKDLEVYSLLKNEFKL